MTTSPSSRPVLACLALLLAATGCSAAEPEVTPRPAIAAGDRYVALGDSYTSGPRLGDRSGGKGCEQTTGNYPHLLAEELQLDLVDVSCGGATTANLSEPQVPPNGTEVPAQLDALTEDTDLVTLSIGGNDGRVFGHLVTTCVGLATRDPEGTPCTALAQSGADDPEASTSELAEKIAEAVTEIQVRAPDARVLVVGYPQIFPASGTCDELPLAAADYPLAREVMAKIVSAQETGAEQAGAEYVDVRAATEGHDACAEEPWVAGIIPTRPALAYHPYAEEQQVVADLLEASVS